MTYSKWALQSGRLKVGASKWALQSGRFKVGASKCVFQNWRFKEGASTSTLCSHMLQAWPHSGTLVAVMYSFPSAFCHFGFSGGPVSEVGGVLVWSRVPLGPLSWELFSSDLRVSGTRMMCCCELMDSGAMLVPSCYEN